MSKEIGSFAPAIGTIFGFFAIAALCMVGAAIG